MTWTTILLALLVWCVASVPVALVLGRVFSRRRSREITRPRRLDFEAAA